MRTSCVRPGPAPCDVGEAERDCIATVALNHDYDALFEMPRTVARANVIEFTTKPESLDRLRFRWRGTG